MESDESDFYGDDDGRLETRVDSFSVESWKVQRQNSSGLAKRQNTSGGETSHLHNPYAGVPYAWQLSETIEHFLARLPPSSTPQSLKVPWIFICNPYISRVEKANSNNRFSEGNEDEAPEEDGNQLGLLIEAAEERLQISAKLKKSLETSAKSRSLIDREMKKETTQAATDILDLAHEVKVRAGKWMLFCRPYEVDEIWGVVARATASNELGIAAKVAPRSQDEDPKRDRLICVYTTDFKDTADVARVLQRLRELKLVRTQPRGIFYKPDAYTYIGIGYDNPWGLRASIYSSNNFNPNNPCVS